MRTAMLTMIIGALVWTAPSFADSVEPNQDAQNLSAISPNHGPHHPHPYPGPGPGPSYLCQGQFWGGFSNGVQATLVLTPTGWNHVNVAIYINGGYTFSGQGTCDDWGAGRAHIDFYVQGPGTGWGHGWGDVWQNGPGAVVQGGMDNGLNFSFSR